MDGDDRVDVLGVRLGRGRYGHGRQVLHLVEQPPGAIGQAGRVDGVQSPERRLEPVRQGVVGRVLVRPDRVAPVVGHLPGVQQRVGGWSGQVAEVGVPRVGEVQDIRRLLDHPDHVGPVLQRVDEGRHVAPAQQVGDALEVVEAQVLLGQEHDEVVGQGLAQAVQVGRFRRLGQVDAADHGPERPRDRLHGQRGGAGRRHVRPGRGARPRCARRTARAWRRRSAPRRRRTPRTGACRLRGAGSRSRT